MTKKRFLNICIITAALVVLAIISINLNTSNYGFENRGNEIMYNGLTGEMFSAKIFIGPAYYQRLKHIVRDKINARNGGEGNPIDQITRQPIKGRKRGGGIRIGEMEKDSLIGHGISQFLKESMVDRSDIYSCVVCKLCGRIAIHNINNNKEINCCKHCDNKQYFTQIIIPHCAKLLIQETRKIAADCRSELNIRT